MYRVAVKIYFSYPTQVISNWTTLFRFLDIKEFLDKSTHILWYIIWLLEKLSSRKWTSQSKITICDLKSRSWSLLCDLIQDIIVDMHHQTVKFERYADWLIIYHLETWHLWPLAKMSASDLTATQHHWLTIPFKIKLRCISLSIQKG